MRRRTQALAELLSTVADEAPLAVLLDDLHWADAASLQMLLGILDRVRSARILVVSTARGPVAGLAGAAPGTQLTLEPLDRPQVGTLLASLGALPDLPWARALPDLLHRTTGGSPLLLMESLQLALGPDGWTAADPPALTANLGTGGALRHRVEQLSPAEHELLLLLAIAGAPVSAS